MCLERRCNKYNGVPYDCQDVTLIWNNEVNYFMTFLRKAFGSARFLRTGSPHINAMRVVRCRLAGADHGAIPGGQAGSRGGAERRDRAGNRNITSRQPVRAGAVTSPVGHTHATRHASQTRDDQALTLPSSGWDLQIPVRSGLPPLRSGKRGIPGVR